MVLSPARSIIPQPYPRGSFVLPFISTAHLSAYVAILRSLFIASIVNHHYSRRHSARFLSPPAVPILTPPASRAITIARVATVRALYHSPPTLPFTVHQHLHLSACSHIAISVHREHRQSSLHTEVQYDTPITTISSYPYTSSITSNHQCACSHSASSLAFSASIFNPQS
jgi:hypothetical protein